MLQRVQTIYLLLAFACILCVLYLPTFNLTVNDVTHHIHLGAGIISKIIFIVMALFPVAAIMLYKKRPIQLKVTRLGLILYILSSIGFISLATFSQNYLVSGLVESGELTEGEAFKLGFGVSYYLMFISVAFMLLAIRGIRADENLVKSLDRLR